MKTKEKHAHPAAVTASTLMSLGVLIVGVLLLAYWSVADVPPRDGRGLLLMTTMAFLGGGYGVLVALGVIDPTEPGRDQGGSFGDLYDDGD